MTIDELKEKLAEILERSRSPEFFDEEVEHGKADFLLTEYIGDPEVTRLFATIPKWYA